MADTGSGVDDAPVEDGEFGDEVSETEFDRLLGIVADGVVGAAGGLVGVAMMTVVLLFAESVGAFHRASFAQMTELMGLGGYVPEITVGFLIFLLGGMVPWPLLFASLLNYLPGERMPVNGIFFGTALWTGFAMAFWDGFLGATLVLYLALTLLAHWVYGACLGFVFEYLSERPDTLV
jgi:hypothetical protein